MDSAIGRQFRRATEQTVARVGEPFQVGRQGSSHTVRGYRESEARQIRLLHDADVKAGDMLTTVASGEVLHVTHVESEAPGGIVAAKIAKYETSTQREQRQAAERRSKAQLLNIGQIYLGEGSLATFDQRGQHVTYQYNAAGNINVGAVQSREDLVGELEKLRTEVDVAASAGAIDKEAATDAKYQLDKAAQQAEKPTPDKTAITTHLTTAKDLVEQVGSAAGLVTGLVQAIEKVRVLF